MTCYIHHVPGRLRVKSPAFKNSGGNAEAVKDLLRAVDGVTGAETNTRTGSVTVYYDDGRIKLPRLLGVFVTNEYIDLRAPLSFGGLPDGGGGEARSTAAKRSDRTLVDTIAENVGKALFETALERLLPRMAAVLLGALA